MSKSADYRRLIGSARWRALRAEKIARSPLCEDCLLEDRATYASEVHHVRPVETADSIRGMEALMFDPNNLRSLCAKCHQKTHECMNSRSKEAIKARAHKDAERFKKKFF